MNRLKLLKFIHEAHKNTYAAQRRIKSKYKSKPISEGHKDYDFKIKDLRYHDSYAGWKWAPGKEIIFYKNKPIWCMSYQGQIQKNLPKLFIKKIHSFLKKALRNSPEDLPLRGPKKHIEGDFEYSFKIEGNYEYFVGKEIIKYKGKEVFFQNIMGSLIK